MQQPSPALVREALQAFADARKVGWKVYEDDRTGSYAARRFEYRNRAQALLSAQPLRYRQDTTRWMSANPLDLVREWSVQVNVPFAAGPEVSASGKYAQVEAWVSVKEKALSLPLTLQECKSWEDGEKMASRLTSDDLVLLTAVFDIDMCRGRRYIVQELVKACVPAGQVPS